MTNYFAPVDRNTPTESAAQPPLIVGVGGSAGSLEAFQRFIEHLPADSRLSIVFVIHLPPTHKSMLSELLSKQTADSRSGKRRHAA